MAQNEITESVYAAIKKQLDSGLSVNKASGQYKLGERRLRLIRKSKSYNSYLALRRNEAKKRAQNTPAKAQPGKHELAQPN